MCFFFFLFVREFSRLPYKLKLAQSKYSQLLFLKQKIWFRHVSGICPKLNISLYWLHMMHLCRSIAFIWHAVFLLLASHLLLLHFVTPHHQCTLHLRLFSAALPQGAWSNRSAMSSPSWSPERSDAWDSPKNRPHHGLPIWTMRLVNEGRVLKGLGSAGDWAFKVGVGHKASAG